MNIMIILLRQGAQMKGRFFRISRLIVIVGIMAMFVLCNGGWPFAGTRSLCSDEQRATQSEQAR